MIEPPPSPVMLRPSLVALFLLFPGIAKAEAPSPAEVVPPRVVRHAPAELPESAKGREITVVLVVTVGADGRVERAEPEVPGDPAVDEAAIEAVRQWQFEPARSGDEAVAAKIRVSVHLAAPVAKEPPAAAPEAPSEPIEGPPAGQAVPPPEPTMEVSVIGRLAPAPRTTSDFVLDRAILASAPRRTAADVLKSAPGLYLSEPEGRGGPPQIFLRGFDTEHGRDLEMLSGGIPLNQPSQVHAHGSVELGTVLPEAIREVRVREGVYDPRQGEFAVAGSIEYELGVVERGIRLSTSYGEHGTFRLTGIYAPEGEAEETFGAFSYGKSAGATPYRAYENAVGIGRYAFAIGSRTRAVFHIASFAGHTRLPGVLREDDIHPEERETPSSDPTYRLGGTYDDPSARGGSVRTARTELSLALEGLTDDGGRFSVIPYVAQTSFVLRENFTGYTLGGDDAFSTGRADFYDERNDDLTIGATAYYRTSRYSLGIARPRFELGTQIRHDVISQTHSLLFADGSAAWREISDSKISQSNVAGYVDADIGIGRHLRLRGGARADLIAQSFEDRIPEARPNALPGIRRDSQSVLVSPRASAEVLPTSWWSVSGGYGQGFRSAPAQLLAVESSPPIARAHSFELGSSLHTPDKDVVFRLIGFRTTMSDDLEFDPTTGTLESIGATSRTGLVASLRTRALGWLESSTSLTYSRAVLEEHEDHDDHDEEEEHGGHHHLPFAPPIVARNDLVASFDIGRFGSDPVRLSLGSAQTLLGRRPLPDGTKLPVVFLLDASAQLRWNMVELGVSAENLLDAGYVDLAYVFASRWSRTRATPEPARHWVGGQPRTVMGTVTLYL